MLYGDDGSVSPDSPQDKLFQWNDCTIRVFDYPVLDNSVAHFKSIEPPQSFSYHFI